MINIRPFSQRDLRWFWKKVGFGSGWFGSIGCTTTALTALLFVAGYDLRPDEVNERLKAVGGFTGSLIYWSKIEKAFPKVKWVYRYYKYDNQAVKEYVNKGVPVLVEVMTKGGKHWVLFLGDMKMFDPWDGKIKATSTYNPIGFSLINIPKLRG
jgi:hypothetical protein